MQPGVVPLCAPVRHPVSRVHHRLLVTLLGIGLFIQGCSTSGGLKHLPAGGHEPAPSRFGILSPEQQALVDASCYDGLPVDIREDLGSTELVIRRGYVLEHSSLDKIPLWVCESVSADQLRGHLARSNRFKADPDLEGLKAYPNDYVGSGYDRGHQAPAGNQTVDPALKDQTFYMSNMAPQRPSLNRGIWKLLEDKTRAWVFRYGHAYEWTGPIRCDPKPPPPPETHVGCQRQTIGEHEVAVPRYFYKIILVQDQSTWKAIAFVLPNTDFKRPYQLESYITSIDWIEKETGVEFMPRMSARERRALSVPVSAMWP
jgi:endonuclease G, mitochondrial